MPFTPEQLREYRKQFPEKAIAYRQKIKQKKMQLLNGSYIKPIPKLPSDIITCDICGASLRRSGIARHRKTLKCSAGK